MTRLLLLPLLLLVPALALAEPRWSVQSSVAIEDFEPEDGCNDLSTYMYHVSNTSTPGDANNLVTFAVPAGSNHGVYLASAPDGWTAEILPDCTIFHGNGNYIPPGSGVIGGTFHLYSTLIGENTNAWAEGESAYNGPFAPVRVSVPAALPPRLTALAPATNGVWLALADLVVPRSSNTVQCAASPTGAWHAVTCFFGNAVFSRRR